MNWIKNLISYSESSVIGNCPVCGSNAVEVTNHTNGDRQSVTFQCRNCGSTDHFDGVTTKR